MSERIDMVKEYLAEAYEIWKDGFINTSGSPSIVEIAKMLQLEQMNIDFKERSRKGKSATA